MSDWLDGLFTEQHLLFLLCLICISGFAAVVKIIGVTADSIAKHLQEIQDSLVESVAEAIRDAEYGKKKNLDNEIEAEYGPEPEKYR